MEVNKKLWVSKTNCSILSIRYQLNNMRVFICGPLCELFLYKFAVVLMYLIFVCSIFINKYFYISHEGFEVKYFFKYLMISGNHFQIYMVLTGKKIIVRPQNYLLLELFLEVRMNLTL